MAITRRELIGRAAVSLPALAFAPNVVLRAAYGSPLAGPRNLVLVELDGGNDGINTIVPYGVDGGTYYSVFRSTLAIPEANLLKVNSEIGFHPALAKLKAHFDAGRLAVVQGCSYPSPNFSHDVAQGIFDTGIPSAPYGPGWVARYVESLGAAPFPLAMEAGSSKKDGVLAGTASLVPALSSLSQFVLPFDSKYPGDKTNRRNTYIALADGLAGSADPSTASMASTMQDIVDLVDTFQAVPSYASVATFPNDGLGKSLKVVCQMLKANLGTRFYHVRLGGFDTHSDQEGNGYHTAKLTSVSESLDALYTDLTALGLMDDTLVVAYTEFGRTVYENGSKGTDHGTITPMLVLGNSVVGGLTTPHPSMNPANLTSSKQPPKVADFRDVWGTIVAKWLNGSVAAVFPGYGFTDLGFLG